MKTLIFEKLQRATLVNLKVCHLANFSDSLEPCCFYEFYIFVDISYPNYWLGGTDHTIEGTFVWEKTGACVYKWKFPSVCICSCVPKTKCLSTCVLLKARSVLCGCILKENTAYLYAGLWDRRDCGKIQYLNWSIHGHDMTNETWLCPNM